MRANLMIDVSIMMAAGMINMEMIIMMVVRLVIVTRAPSCKSLFAKALPKPWADPVITTTRPFREHFKAIKSVPIQRQKFDMADI